MNYMKLLLFLCVTFITGSIVAQDSTWRKMHDSGSVRIHKDPRLDMLVKKAGADQ